MRNFIVKFSCGELIFVNMRYNKEPNSIFLHPGTVKGAPPGRGDEVPTWPGISASELEGKRFQTFAIDFHSIRDGLIQQTWHLEDYGTALGGMLNGSEAPNFGFNRQFIGE